MHPSVDDLRAAVGRFRRARAQLYLSQLAEALQEPDPGLLADLVAPCQPERVQAYVELAAELPAPAHAALGAHMLRAHVERAVRGARERAARWGLRPVEVGGARRALGAQWGDGQHLRSPAARDALLRATAGSLADVHETQRAARGKAVDAAAAAFRQLAPARHPDAGDEAGVSAPARDYLEATRELQREATQTLARAQGIELRHVADLFAALRCAELAPVAPEGRGRRLGALWQGLGLRDVLNRAVRVGPPHAAGWPGAQVVVRAPASGLVIAPSMVEAGLASELAWLEATGRAVGLAMASASLPIELRQPAVGSTARALGQVAVLALIHPGLWQRSYAVGRRQARLLAQATAAYALCRSRLHAAAALAADGGPDELASLAEQALGVPVPVGLASALLLRLSPGGDARASLHAAGIAAALRDRFDEDWLRNPRAAEPLMGASLAGGERPIEAAAAELGADRKAGLSMLAELF